MRDLTIDIFQMMKQAVPDEPVRTPIVFVENDDKSQMFIPADVFIEGIQNGTY